MAVPKSDRGFAMSTASVALGFLGILFGSCKSNGITLVDGAVDAPQGTPSTSTETGNLTSTSTGNGTGNGTTTISGTGSVTTGASQTSTGQGTVTIPNSTSTGTVATTNATSTATAATTNATSTATTATSDVTAIMTSTASVSGSSPTALSSATSTSLGTVSATGNPPDASARDTLNPSNLPDGPCDIYADAKTPCVAAYSMIRVLSKTYNGPLFQLRAGSSSTNSTMSGGATTDIMPGPDGFARTSFVDNVRGKDVYRYTISVLYDQSGNGNHLMRAPKGNSAAGEQANQDDYESMAGKGTVQAGGQRAYSLLMNKHEGYRLQTGVVGNNVPTGTQPQGLYLLADGTRDATACCWEFGNVTSKPATEFAFVDALFLGIPSFQGRGNGAGPWFLTDFGSGLWAGGSRPGDPGSPGIDLSPPNTGNPSLAVPFALGFLKVDAQRYAIRVADLSTASEPVTAFAGTMPLTVNHQGGIVLGVGANNENASWGTFYEGAIVAGYPSNEVELAVMKNIKGVGYAK